MNGEYATDEEIDAARREYADDDIQIDDKALVARTDDGAWVQAWVWVSTEKEDTA